VATDESNKPA